MTRGRKLAPERKALMDACVADGWPIRQMVETHGFNFSTIKRHHPDYRGMDQREAGSLSMAMRYLNQKIART